MQHAGGGDGSDRRSPPPPESPWWLPSLARPRAASPGASALPRGEGLPAAGALAGDPAGLYRLENLTGIRSTLQEHGATKVRRSNACCQQALFCLAASLTKPPVCLSRLLLPPSSQTCAAPPAARSQRRPRRPAHTRRVCISRRPSASKSQLVSSLLVGQAHGKVRWSGRCMHDRAVQSSCTTSSKLEHCSLLVLQAAAALAAVQVHQSAAHAGQQHWRVAAALCSSPSLPMLT